jgi:hypothetical protein
VRPAAPAQHRLRQHLRADPAPAGQAGLIAELEVHAAEHARTARLGRRLREAAKCRAWPPGAESVTWLNGMASLQKKPASTVAAAAENALWPEVCSGDVPAPPLRGLQFPSAQV